MRHNKKIVCIGIIEAAAFLLIFLILFQGATLLFQPKVNFYELRTIYDLPENSVDVLLLGTSHMNASISPMDLWNDYGITSFNAGISEQTIPATYFELRELIKVQTPKVVVLETYYIYMKEIITSRGVLHILVDQLPLSQGVSEAIQTLVPEDQNKTEFYMNFYSFHNRWKDLTEVDFRPWLTYGAYNRGADTRFLNQLSKITESPSIVPRSETELPPELPLEYLYKIIELCRENGISLVFMAAPFNAGDNVQKKLNYIDVVAGKEGIPYINFFYLLDEIGFDFTKDNGGSGSHVNYLGMRKLTSYLGEYLQTNYQLKDHRGDPDIAELWNKDCEVFAREINKVLLKLAVNTDEYFAYLRKEDYILAWNAYSETPLSETALSNFLENMGIDLTGIKDKKWYCAVTEGNQMLYGSAFDIRPNTSYMADDTLFSFGRGIVGSKNRIGIHAGRTEYSMGDNGLNLVVYDPVTRTVVDSVNIALDTRDIKRG